MFISGYKQVKIGDFGLARYPTRPGGEIVLSGDDKVCKTIFLKSADTGAVYDWREESALSVNVGTPMYIAPELENGLPYDEKVDVYSLGLIFFEMLNKFSTEHERHHILTDFKKKRIAPNTVGESYPLEMKIILQMTESSPEKRPKIIQIKNSPEYTEMMSILGPKN